MKRFYKSPKQDDMQMPERVKQILIVDDCETFLFSIADSLSIYKNELNILTAENGIEAVNILKSSPIIDLVVTGLVMPKMDGFELIAYMNKNYPKIPVILMTGSGMPKIKEISYNMGVFRFFEKPLDLDMLADTIFAGLGIRTVKTYTKNQAKMKISGEQREEILKWMNSADDSVKGLYNLAHLFKSQGRYGESIFCLRELLERSTDMRANVTYLLTLGQIMENMNEFEDAVSYYHEASTLCNVASDTFYWINNNMGFSLCMLKRFHEAERCCRLAIEIDPSRLNAFKNLGLSLEGQGRLREAIDAYITAIKINANDTRSMALLEKLLNKHPELKEVYNESLKECRSIVENANQHHEKKEQLH